MSEYNILPGETEEHTSCAFTEAQAWKKRAKKAEAELARLDEWVQAESHGASLLADNPVDGAIEIAGGRVDQIKGLEAELADCNQRLTDARGIIKKLTTVDKEYLKQKQRTEAERDKLLEALEKIIDDLTSYPCSDDFGHIIRIARDALGGGET